MSKSIYVRGASKTLRKKLEEMQEESSERLSLAGEVDLARVLALRAVKVFDATHYGDKAADVDEEMKVASRMAMRDSLDHVSSLVEKFAKVSALTKNAYSPDQVQQLIMQIQRVLEEHLLPTHKDVFDSIVESMAQFRTTEGGPARTVMIT